MLQVVRSRAWTLTTIVTRRYPRQKQRPMSASFPPSSSTPSTASTHAYPPFSSTLADFSTCELSDALIKLGSPHGGHIPDIHRISAYEGSEDERVCGPAYTVKMVMANDVTDVNAPRLKEHFVDTAEEGSVMVIDAPPRASRKCYHIHCTLFRTNITFFFAVH